VNGPLIKKNKEKKKKGLNIGKKMRQNAKKKDKTTFQRRKNKGGRNGHVA